MSYYSDGEKFNEYDPPYCERCNRGNSAEECKSCEAARYEEQCRAEGQRCETCYFYKWSVYKEIFYCDCDDSDWHGEECYDDGWCEHWMSE